MLASNLLYKLQSMYKLQDKFKTGCFKNLYDFQAAFSNDLQCRQFLANAIWENGEPVCPYCSNRKIYKYSNGIHYKCSDCRKRFTVTVNTIFESSRIPLGKWFLALYLLSCHKKGISSVQLSKDVGVTQRTAWFMLHRLRSVYTQNVEVNEDTQLTGIVECDETFCGGKNKNRHWDKKIKNSQGRSYKDKTPVLGILQRGGELRAFVVPDTNKQSVQPHIKKHIQPGSELMTDEWYGYYGLGSIYNHSVVDHGRGQYVNGDITTNSIESAWACLKRSIYGIYHFASRKHMQRYVDETVYRYNTRNWEAEARVSKTLSWAYGKRLTYANLVA